MGSEMGLLTITCCFSSATSNLSLSKLSCCGNDITCACIIRGPLTLEASRSLRTFLSWKWVVSSIVRWLKGKKGTQYKYGPGSLSHKETGPFVTFFVAEANAPSSCPMTLTIFAFTKVSELWGIRPKVEPTRIQPDKDYLARIQQERPTISIQAE